MEASREWLRCERQRNFLEAAKPTRSALKNSSQPASLPAKDTKSGSRRLGSGAGRESVGANGQLAEHLGPPRSGFKQPASKPSASGCRRSLLPAARHSQLTMAGPVRAN